MVALKRAFRISNTIHVVLLAMIKSGVRLADAATLIQKINIDLECILINPEKCP